MATIARGPRTGAGTHPQRRRPRGLRSGPARRADPERRRRLRRGAAGVERQHRPPPGADRPLPRRRRRAGGHFARDVAACRVGARRRAQRARATAPTTAAWSSTCRPMKGIRVDPAARTARPGRRAVARARPRDAGIRARHDRRHGVEHRHRRADSRRRSRLADGQARPDGRQPVVGRRRHRRRHVPHGQRDGEPRSVLGAARRRRQLRRRHVVRVPPAPGRHRCSAAWSSTRSTRPATCCASTASSARRCRTRPRPMPGCSPRPTAMPGRRDGARLQRPIAEGERVLAPARPFGQPIVDLVGADALRRPPDHARRAERDPRAAPLLALGVRRAISDDLIDAMVEERGAVQLAAQRAAVLLHARRRDPRARRRHGVRGPPPAVGLRRHRAVDGRSESADHIAWVRALWAGSSRTWTAAATSTTLPETSGPKRCAPRTGENYARLRQLKAVFDP